MIISIDVILNMLGSRIFYFCEKKLGYRIYDSDLLKKLVESMYNANPCKLTIDALEYMYTAACEEQAASLEEQTLFNGIEDDVFGVLNVPEGIQNAV